MNVSIPPAFRPYALALLVLDVVAGLVLAVVVIVTGHDLSDPHISTLLGQAVLIATVLIAALGLSAQIHTVSNSINGRMTELVDTAAASGFQAGQAAPPGSPIPPPPSTLAASAPVNPSPPKGV